MCRDHPRSRGVYCEGRPGLGHVSGSSPLARGLHHAASQRLSAPRIIPARAGFTPRPTPVRTWQWGSSPLARGLQGQLPEPAAFLGIIPARAGFTWSPSNRACSRTDHPRSRGVYLPRPKGSLVGLGSSPLARGLPLVGDTEVLRQGIIPARAGFTPGRSRRRPGWQDHPRSRGVYLIPEAPWLYRTGSSPLARGLLWLRCLRGRCRGIIPARAGFTG